MAAGTPTAAAKVAEAERAMRFALYEVRMKEKPPEHLRQMQKNYVDAVVEMAPVTKLSQLQALEMRASIILGDAMPDAKAAVTAYQHMKMLAVGVAMTSGEQREKLQVGLTEKMAGYVDARSRLEGVSRPEDRARIAGQAEAMVAAFHREIADAGKSSLSTRVVRDAKPLTAKSGDTLTPLVQKKPEVVAMAREAIATSRSCGDMTKAGDHGATMAAVLATGVVSQMRNVNVLAVGQPVKMPSRNQMQMVVDEACATGVVSRGRFTYAAVKDVVLDTTASWAKIHGAQHLASARINK